MSNPIFFPQTPNYVPRERIPPPPGPKVMVRRHEYPSAPVERRQTRSPEAEHRIVAEVCAEFRVTLAQICGDGRAVDMVEARRRIAGRLDRELGYSTTNIGRILSRHPSSILGLLGRTKRARHRLAESAIVHKRESE